MAVTTFRVMTDTDMQEIVPHAAAANRSYTEVLERCLNALHARGFTLVGTLTGDDRPDSFIFKTEETDLAW
jgi:hypothetical protein